MRTDALDEEAPMTRAPGRSRRTTALLGAVTLALTTATAATAAPSGAPDGGRGDDPRGPVGGWVTGWQGSPTAGGTFDPATCPADIGLEDQTVRDVVPVSVDGDQVRVRVSNAFGAQPLRVGSASVAVAAEAGSAATEPGTLRPLEFAGEASVLLAAGGEALSDPVPLEVEALEALALSIHLPEPTGPATQHNNSRATNFLAPGDATRSADGDDFTRPITCWLFASGVDVRASRRVVGTVVTLGDSITDGDQSTVDADQRYPDHLARRLDALRGRTLSVSNAGIGGNELLYDRVPELFGVSAPNRLARDALTEAGATDLILLEGTNDLGAESARAADLIDVQEQIIAQSRAAGLGVYGGTIPPFGGSNEQYGAAYGTPQAEVQRQLLNTWIRTSGAFDGVVDFDAALRDPADPTRMLPAYDSGDHLHPGDAGYRAMAEAVDLRMLLDDR